MKRIIFFGTGFRGKKLYKLFRHYEMEMEYWVDSDQKKWETILGEKFIYPPSKLKHEKDVDVCISAVDTTEEMYNTLLQCGIPECRIQSFAELVIQCMLSHYTWNQPEFISQYQNIILECFNGLSMGGVESWSIDLHKELMEKGKKAYLLAPYGKYDIENKLRKNILWTDIKPQNIFSWENLEHSIETLINKMPFTLISSFVNDVLLAACCLKRKYPEQVRIISVVHNGQTATYKKYVELNQYIERYVAVSEEIKQGMIKYGIKVDKLSHMTCPVECVEPYLKKYNMDKSFPVKIGYAGRIEKDAKRMDCLVELLLNLEKLRTKYYMEIAGTGGYAEQLAEEIKRYGFERKVRLVGKINRNKIASFWIEQDICINLSDTEGRSISVMEAMKNGAVPVVTATSGVREDIKEGFNGCIVAIKDYVSMAEKIDYLSKNRELLLLYGERAHNTMMQKSDMDRHMEFWNKILKN